MDYLDSEQVPQLWKLAHRTAFRILREVHDAEDVAQETLVALWKTSCGGEAVVNPHAWVRSAAYRIALRIRKRQRRVILVPGFDERQMSPTEGCSDVACDLDAFLPPVYRTVFRLHYVEDMTVGEVARRLQIPVGTVKWRLHRIRRYFREIRQHIQ